VDGIGRSDRRGQVRRLAGHEDIDVRSEPRSAFDQPIAQPRDLPIESVDDRRDVRAIDGMPALDAREQGEE
jgi:hypothetical protein